MAGETLTKPVVARTSSRRFASSRNSIAERAAAMKASLRTSIGVDPEWACWPVKRTACRSTPNVPSTTPRGRSMRSRTGPCSMCSSRYAAAFSSCLCDSFILSRSTPCSERASGSATPSLSLRFRTSSGLRMLAVALEPKRLRPKRAPSSSAHSTSRKVTGRCCGASTRRTSSAPMTLRAPRSEEHTSELQSHRDLHSFPTRRSSDLGALLVGPLHEPQSDGALLRCEHPQDLKRPDDVESAIEPAAVRDGVYVPAEQDGLLGVARRGGPDVAGLVAFDLHAVYLFELVFEPLARLDPLVCPGHPACALRTAGQFGELLELVYGAAGVYLLGALHQPTFSLSPAAASASSKTSAPSSAASRVTVSGGETRTAFAFMPPLPTRTPRSLHACMKPMAACGFGSPSGPTSSMPSIRPRPRTSPMTGWLSAIFMRRSLR